MEKLNNSAKKIGTDELSVPILDLYRVGSAEPATSVKIRLSSGVFYEWRRLSSVVVIIMCEPYIKRISFYMLLSIFPRRTIIIAAEELCEVAGAVKSATHRYF